MSETEELLDEILFGMKRKYMAMLEVERVTKELTDTLAMDDRESTQLLLDIRQGEIEKIEEVHYALKELASVLLDSNQVELVDLMNGKQSLLPMSEKESEIRKTANLTKNLYDRILSIDKVLNRKIAGKDSYYG